MNLPYLCYQLYLSLSVQYDCTPPKCGQLVEYTGWAHSDVENVSSIYMNV